MWMTLILSEYLIIQISFFPRFCVLNKCQCRNVDQTINFTQAKCGQGATHDQSHSKTQGWELSIIRLFRLLTRNHEQLLRHNFDWRIFEEVWCQKTSLLPKSTSMVAFMIMIIPMRKQLSSEKGNLENTNKCMKEWRNNSSYTRPWVTESQATIWYLVVHIL